MMARLDGSEHHPFLPRSDVHPGMDLAFHDSFVQDLGDLGRRKRFRSSQ
jgi:hypothetical protein